MTTVHDKTDPAEARRAQNGQDAGPAKTRRERPRAFAYAKNASKAFVDFTSSLPGTIKAKAESNPIATVAAVAGVSFVLGMVLGSKLARVVVMGAVGYGVNRLVDSVLAQEIGRYRGEATADAVTGATHSEL